MRKITLKISAFLLLTMFTLQGHSQALDDMGNETTDFGFFNSSSLGTWEVKLRDQVGGVDLFLTLRNDLNLEYAQYVGGATQQWIFQAHPTVNNMLIMTSVQTGGFIEIDASNMTTATPKVGMTDSNLAQIQMRKIASNEPDYSANGDLPGQNQIFFRGDYAGTAWPGQSSAYRFGVTPVEGAVITLDTSGDAFRFKFLAPLSNEEFDTSSIFVSNPVSNQLTIKGLTNNINEVSVYSLLGKQVLTRELDGQSFLTIDVSALTSGMYLVKMRGDNGSFTKKIVKQ